ncbi:sensor histidine kinase, partial [Longibacter sp.]|uniref:sensor histidine kinase n=1 Tax=Longibacter sp. TaxID=2045415 RepID=UPI003EBB1985
LAALALRASPTRVLQVGIDADVRADVLRSMQSAFLAILLPVILIALLGGTFLAYRALRPVRRLVQTFHTVIETGDVQTRAPADEAAGEFATLVHLFNRMLDRIEQLVGGMRETVDNVAHALRTPMTRLRARAELALQKDDDAEALRDALAELVDTSDVVLDMLDGIMDVAEAEADTLSLSKSTVRVQDLLRDVADAYGMVAEEKDVSLTVDVPADLSVVVDPGRMRQVFANLFDNAVKYTPAGGSVSVTAEQTSFPDQADAAACITIRDTGTGIPEKDLPRIWDRLYRGDRSRSEKGLGLGLSLVRAIAHAHNGRVTVDSTPGKGSTFRVYLPAEE